MVPFVPGAGREAGQQHERVAAIQFRQDAELTLGEEPVAQAAAAWRSGRLPELKGALLTNPHDQADLVATLRLALTMTDGERDSRQRTLFEIVSQYDLARWGRDFLQAVRQ